MCGIIGFTGNYSRQVLSEMIKSVSHRGPDDLAFYQEKVSLGMKRLSIIDLRKKLYPLKSDDGKLILIYNGEIYNHQALKNRFPQLAEKLVTKIDGEVILYLYQKYGERCLKYLEGMFAFVIYDKDKEQLFCARDRFGEKPFYYSEKNGEIIFGSEAKSLLVHPSVSKKISHQSLYYYLRFGFSPLEKSIFEDIKKLLPGHYLIWDLKGKRVTVKRYWSLDTYFDKNMNYDMNSVLSRTENYLLSSIKSRLISDVPIGVFLSGGVDSSLVTAIASRFYAGTLSTFSVKITDSSLDESEKALEISKNLGTKHYQVTFSASDIIGNSVGLNERADEPICDPGAIPTFKMSFQAKKKVKVVLTGEGADELFGGYGWYKKNLNFESKWGWLPKPLGTIKGKVLPCKFIRLFSPLTVNYFPPQYFSIWKAAKLITSRKVIFDDPFYDFKQKGFSDPLQLMQYVDVKSYLADHLLTKVDRATMAHGLEARTVFLEHNFFNYIYNLPIELKIFDENTEKYILRKVAEKYLPRSYCWQKKQGFSLPLANWLRKEIYSFSRETIGNIGNLDLPLNMQYAFRLLDQHKSGLDNSHSLWNLICLINWYKGVN